MAAPNTNRTDSEEDRAIEQVPLQHGGQFKIFKPTKNRKQVKFTDSRNCQKQNNKCLT